MTRPLSVAVIGDFDDTHSPHEATNGSLQHAAASHGVEVRIGWLATEPLERDAGAARGADALWCAPGSPYRSLLGALEAPASWGENDMPTLDTCGDCQTHSQLASSR
jgi:CTP synthase (UTP-ammonia lyase)